MPSDKVLINCGEDHELIYMLGRHAKELSGKNIEKLRSACHEFKKDISYEPHNRVNFYRFIVEKGIDAELEE